jgi:hypothetical protein
MFKGASLGSFGVIRGQGTASLFEGAGQAVYARERKRISVDIFEVGVGRTASIHSFHPMPEANSTSRPLLELTISVIGKKIPPGRCAQRAHAPRILAQARSM